MLEPADEFVETSNSSHQGLGTGGADGAEVPVAKAGRGPRRQGYEHDPALVSVTVAAIRDSGIDFATYLPETILYPVMNGLEGEPSIQTFSVSREDEGVGMCVGAFLAGKSPALLTEASGLGLSALILARAVVQRTPLLLLASHNSALGERHDYGSAARRVAEPLLESLSIPYVTVHAQRDVPGLIHEAQQTVLGDRRPVAILFPPHSLRKDGAFK